MGEHVPVFDDPSHVSWDDCVKDVVVADGADGLEVKSFKTLKKFSTTVIHVDLTVGKEKNIFKQIQIPSSVEILSVYIPMLLLGSISNKI